MMIMMMNLHLMMSNIRGCNQIMNKIYTSLMRRYWDSEIPSISLLIFISQRCQVIKYLLRQKILECKIRLFLQKKNNIDGYTLICTLTDHQMRKEVRNIFNEDQIKMLFDLSILFLMQQFRRERYKQLKTLQKKSTFERDQEDETMKSNTELHELIIGSEHSLKSFQEDNQESLMGSSEIMDTSQLGESVMGESVMGESVMGESDYGESEYGGSVRGSIYANSQYEAPTRQSIDCRMSFNVIRTSFLYDAEVFNSMKFISLDLPFDLLNLEPLQQIKVRALATPFGLQKVKDHWIFSVQGVKFGRDKLNDLIFPDQLSISSKHAQIIFNNDSFHLQDVGSKTGTYLRINKILTIEQQTCLQLSPQIEIVFRIIKKNKKDGLIKAQIKRPQNYPDYKVSLRQGYRVEIGRSEKCHIRINNSSLAEHHAEIFYKNGTFFLKNQQPKLGLWQRLSQKSVKSDTVKLRKGDIFRLSSKKSFIVEDIINQIGKSSISVS